MRLPSLNTISVILMFTALISLGITMSFLQIALAEPQIFIDQYRPIGTESVVQVNTEDYVTRYTNAVNMVQLQINDVLYESETNRYGYIAFPIKLTDNVFETGVYNLTVTVRNQTYYEQLYVIDNSY